MKNFDVVTIGGAVRDITFYTGRGKVFSTPDDLTAQKMIAFEYGAKIEAQKTYYELGGGAANTAVSLSRLKFKTAALVRLGKDQDAKEIIEQFKKERVSADLIQTDTKEHTGFSFILAMDKKEKEHVAFLWRGANSHLSVTRQQLATIKAGWFYIASLSGQSWSQTIKTIFEAAKDKKRNTKIAWNPGNHQLHAGQRGLGPLLKQTDILLLNKDEAIELVLSGISVGRRNPSYLNRPLYLLNILKDWGPKVVLITDGSNGAWAYDGKKIYRQKAKSTNKIVNTTGVGDAFGSSFLAGYITTRGDIARSLKWGVTNAAAVCTQVGAQNGLLRLEELKSKL